MQIYALEFINRSVIYFEDLADAVKVQANSSASLCPRLVVIPVIPSSLLTHAAPDAGERCDHGNPRGKCYVETCGFSKPAQVS